MTISDKKSEYWWYLVLLVVGFFSFYFALGSYHLLDNNEGLYASIARWMSVSKNFIIPHLNGVPYIEKPPLLYWLISASFSVFGFSAFAARLVTVTSAVLVCVALVWVTKKIKQSQVGIIGALIFASSVGVSVISRMVYFDMLFTLLITGALLSFFYWYETEKKSSLRFGYLFLALAVLTKGLVAGVLICGGFILFLALEKDLRRLYKIFDLLGITLFLAVVLPWHIAAIMEHKGFAWQYLVEEHFLRFLDQREPHDYYHGPLYYYLPRIMIYLFPWSFFMPLIFWRAKDTNESERRFLRFCWGWVLLPLLFFSFSSAKANYYMIVSMPVLAMILGSKIIHLIKSARPRVFNLWGATIILILTAGFGVGYYILVNKFQLAIINIWFFIIVIACGMIGAIVAAVLTRKREIILALIASFIIPTVIIGISFIKVIQNDVSTAVAGNYLTSQAKNEELYLYQDFENISAVSFYAPRQFKIIDSKSSDLYYGEHLSEFKHLFVGKGRFLQETSGKQDYVVVPIKKLSQFYKEMAPAKFFVLKKFKTAAVLKKM